jgi:carboxymethylenebutenolidase
MNEEQIEIAMPEGKCDAVWYRPGEERSFPGVVYLSDIYGIREASRGMARRLAGVGYTVLMPNIFYRTRRPPMFDFPFRSGDERFAGRMAELTAPLTPEAVERDAAGYVDFLAGNHATGPGPMGVVGFCFSGAVAIRIAAMRPDRIAAVASFHGGRLFTDGPASPHLLLPRIKSRLYFGHATDDRSMPREAIENFNRALASWGGRYESEIYEGAYHGWTVPDSPVYNHPLAERAFQKLTQLLLETLQASA